MREKITNLLKEYYGEEAEFREGQLEAIESTYMNPRTLVVQKTGWGKSLVYFLSTKLFRSEGKGITLVVSPLLVLMENQKDAAIKLKIKCTCLNSLVKNENRTSLINDIVRDKYDLVFITPENLFKPDVQEALPNINISLFVIDEAHCISDWGHDFRLEYGKLNKVLRRLPASVHVLGTTATANDRVVNDLKVQLGNDVFISRGSLTRESLTICNVELHDTASRYAWILRNINKLPGTGIIYCLTQKDCDYLANFLCKNGVSARAYYAKNKEEEIENQQIIKEFFENRIKVVVATIKLGMGFDKGDIGFVIHYQMPSNIVSYYQQIGRAGRNIDKAYAILMSGKEDLDIINHFINTAFPSEDDCIKIVNELKKHNGLSSPYISGILNMKSGKINKALMFLENEGFVYKEGSKYYVSTKKFSYNKEHYDKITNTRIKERDQMVELVKTKKCLNQYIVNCLDDDVNCSCGKCSNCNPNTIFENEFTKDEIENVLSFINSLEIEIKPRKQWPSKDFFGKQKIESPLLYGICLSKYNDIGYGKLVRKGKYETNQFSDELVQKSVSLLKSIIIKYNIKYITNVPSLNSNIVEEFTKRLAWCLNIQYINVLVKSPTKPQKDMNNSYHQCRNAINSFSCKSGRYTGNIILVDDMVDSRWTLTVCGYYLKQAGFNDVFPYALADTSNREENND